VTDHFEMNAVLEKDRISSPVSIGVLVERRYLSQAQPQGMISAMQRWGHRVTVIDPQWTAFEMGDDEWSKDFDVVVARGRSWGVLSMLTWAEAHGIPTINRRSAIAAVHNKAEMAVALTTAHIPTPLTLMGPTKVLASHLAARDYPVILKPIFGDNGHGLKVVHASDKLAEVQWPEPVALAQKFIPGSDHDLKLYGIGNEVWAVRKPSPFQGTRNDSMFSLKKEESRPHPVPLTPEMEDLALRCREVFNLDLYGLDCLETDEGLVVIEVNEFPNYSGVPEADRKLAHHVFQHAMRRRSS
jgi:RimK family alpha-L-glutamate ligase